MANNHYIPRVYLKGFRTNRGKNNVATYNKVIREHKSSNVGKIFAIKDGDRNEALDNVDLVGSILEENETHFNDIKDFISNASTGIIQDDAYKNRHRERLIKFISFMLFNNLVRRQRMCQSLYNKYRDSDNEHAEIIVVRQLYDEEQKNNPEEYPLSFDDFFRAFIRHDVEDNFSFFQGVYATRFVNDVAVLSDMSMTFIRLNRDCSSFITSDHPFIINPSVQLIMPLSRNILLHASKICKSKEDKIVDLCDTNISEIIELCNSGNAPLVKDHNFRTVQEFVDFFNLIQFEISEKIILGDNSEYLRTLVGDDFDK